MVVLNYHAPRPRRNERRIMQRALVACATEFYRGRPFWIDETMHTHPAHAHMHARPR
jgi:hypothetical protein